MCNIIYLLRYEIFNLRFTLLLLHKQIQYEEKMQKEQKTDTFQ